MERSLEHLKRLLDPVPPGKCLIGLSGGADSVALLLLLTADDGKEANIQAVHVNHGIRGNESDRDEAFVKQLCLERDIPLHIYHPDLKGRTDENTAREARYHCFLDCYRKTGADYLALAHHADDLAETFMMRLLRGAGAEGLACMKEELFGMRILRPMLRMNRNMIRETLSHEGFAWREDESNRNPAYLRNDVRMRLIPLMEEMRPGASLRIAAAARSIAADNETLDLEIRNTLKQCAGKRWIDFRAVSVMTAGQQARLLRQWWRDNAPALKEHELSAQQTEKLRKLCLSDRGKVNLPGGLYAVKGKQALHLTGFPDPSAPEKTVTGEETFFGDCILTIGRSEGNPGNGRTEQEVPAGFTDGCVIRTRKPGDRIVPFGMTGQKKMQDYLTDRGIDEPWRDRIPLLCRGNEVLLAAGVGAGNIPVWIAQRENIRLHWHGDMPWNR